MTDWGKCPRSRKRTRQAQRRLGLHRHQSCLYPPSSRTLRAAPRQNSSWSGSSRVDGMEGKGRPSSTRPKDLKAPVPVTSLEDTLFDHGTPSAPARRHLPRTLRRYGSGEGVGLSLSQRRSDLGQG